jgi:hypothetical protein
MRRMMRLSAATIGALLITVSQPALAQGHDGEPPQGEWQQGEVPQAEPQQAELQPLGESQAEMHQPEMPQSMMEQAETPPPQTAQAETQPPAMPEPQPEQAETRPPAMPEPQAERAEARPPAIPEAQPEQAKTQPPAMPEPQTEQAETQPPLTPEPQPEQAEARPTTPQPETEQAETRPPAMPEPEMQTGTVTVALPRDAKWSVFVEPSLGTRMDLPSAVFSTSDGAAYRGVGRQFKTADGRAVVAIYSQRNDRRDTPASYLRKNFVFPRAAVAYERITRDFFAVSGINDGMIFYSRCNVSPTGATLHCFDMKYPAREKTAWDAIVTRMSRSLRPLNR